MSETVAKTVRVSLNGKSRDIESGHTVRSLLESSDSSIRSAAVGAVGALGDAEAIPSLIEILDVDVGRNRGAARQALARISGHVCGSDPDRWRSWYRGEAVWWRERSGASA